MMTTTHLQGIGIVNAKPAGELQPGDVTIWNYGYQQTVIGVERLSPKFVRLALVTKGDESGKIWYRRTGINFAVAVAR